MKHATDIKYLILSLLLVGGTLPLAAQESAHNSGKKAWEFGLGGTVHQFNRTSFSNFSTLDNGGYMFDLDLKNTVWGAHIYVARELGDHFYMDIQGNAGHAGKTLGDNGNWLYSAGLGLQWRPGEYFGSKYIDPYLRVGAGYMHKDFTILYVGTEGLSPDEMAWVHRNIRNKDGIDRKNLLPVTVGAGVNMWLNDRWGIGMQGDYVFMPYKNVANSLQGTVRLMYRLGGKSKQTAGTSVVRYIDRPVEVERIVEKTVEVEKIVEVPGKQTLLMSLFDNLHFDFDKATLTGHSRTVLDRIAEIMKNNTDDRFLVSGFTDARGTEQYNQNLSERRAKAVVDALVNRGVPESILIARGAGKKIAIAQTAAPDEIRRGDRKVTIEIVTDPGYWEYLQKRLY